MPITTPYSWQVPVENTDAWYTDFDRLASQIDATVSSVLCAVFPRGGVLLEAGLTTIPSSPGATTWQPWSVAASDGALVASFNIQRSGAVFLACLEAVGNASVNNSNVVDSPIRFRAIVNPGSLWMAGSSWLFTFRTGGPWMPLQFTATTSLGPGRYSVGLEHLSQGSSMNIRGRLLGFELLRVP